MTANPHRGDVEVALNGAAFTLRPTFDRLAACEASTGRTLQALAADALNGALGLRDSVAILEAGLTAKPADVGRAVVESGGVLAVAPAVGRFLLHGLTGGRDSEDADEEAPPPGELAAPEGDTRSGACRAWLRRFFAGRR